MYFLFLSSCSAVTVEQLSIVTTVEISTGIIASSLATLRPLIAGSLTSKRSGTLSSFGSTPRPQPRPQTASLGLNTERSMHSLVEAEARYGTKKGAVQAYRQQQQEHLPSQGELVPEVVFLTDATDTSFFADESDHEARWNDGHPPRRGDARQLAIQKVELAHIKNGADTYHTWAS
jgi:hypothetical protein